MNRELCYEIRTNAQKIYLTFDGFIDTLLSFSTED